MRCNNIEVTLLFPFELAGDIPKEMKEMRRSCLKHNTCCANILRYTRKCFAIKTHLQLLTRTKNLS